MVTLKNGDDTKHISNPDLIKLLLGQGWVEVKEEPKEAKEVKGAKASKSVD